MSEVPTPFVVPMITAHLRRHEPLHPATEITIFMRPQQQVKVVCHQTIPSQPHRHFLVSLRHQAHKRGEVIIVVKNIAAAIALVQDIVKKQLVMLWKCVASLML